MVIFSLKLLNNLRKALAGRRFPHQLAGGVALGVLLGVIPHGNLLAAIVLIALLCFRVNHAIMGVVAILVTFGATYMDNYSHAVGEYLLLHSTGNRFATQAWSLPLVPWTDLNNTVVLGSFVIGVASVLPVFALTLPVFRLIAPVEDDKDALSGESETETSNDSTRIDSHNELRGPSRFESPEHGDKKSASDAPGNSASDVSTKHSVSVFVDREEELTAPRFIEITDDTDQAPESSSTPTIPIDRVLEVEPAFRPVPDQSTAPTEQSVAPTDKTLRQDTGSATEPLPTNEQMVSVETRIDVIRMKDVDTDESPSNVGGDPNGIDHAEQPMDEALNYLLRQLRNSQQRKAAG